MTQVRKQVNRVLIITLFLNLLVAFGKIALGLITGALAVTADGFHSLADGTSNIIALIANNIAGRPPDSNHPYGHERFETLATLGIGLLLLVTVWETMKGIVDRIFGGGEAQIPPIAFGVMLATLVINIFVNRYQVARGQALKSPLLLADAAHTGADIFVTISVLVSMLFTSLLGWQWADIVTALFVVVLIIRTAWKILSQTGSILVDTAPYTPEEIIHVVADIPTVQQVVRARSRGAQNAAYIDVDVEVPAVMTAEQTAEIAATLREKIHDNLEGVAEVEVHFMPADPRMTDCATAIRILADKYGMRTHSIYQHQLENERILDLHVEVPAHFNLSEAHEAVSGLENEIKALLPDIHRVVTHIEPLTSDQPVINTQGEQDLHLADEIIALLQHDFARANWHEISVHTQARGLTLIVDAALPAQMSVEEAHIFAEEAERAIRDRYPQIDRVTIHTEPYTEPFV